jgi:hypothetical protein
MKQFRTLSKGKTICFKGTDPEDLEIIEVKPKNSMGYSFIGKLLGINNGKILFQQFEDYSFEVEWDEVHTKSRKTVLKYLSN